MNASTNEIIYHMNKDEQNRMFYISMCVWEIIEIVSIISICNQMEHI